MRPRTFVLITLMVLCHRLARAQVLTNALPPSQSATQSSSQIQNPQNNPSSAANLPDDPSLEALPIAEPEPIPQTGVPVRWKADRETWAGRTATLYGVEDFQYRD